jgi:hypothetical protein
LHGKITHAFIKEHMKRFWVTLVSLAIVGTIAYLGWQKLSPDQKDTDTNNSQQQTTDALSEGGKYLVINEWNVRFILPEDLRGTISYMDRKNSELETFALISKDSDLENCAPLALTRSQQAGFGEKKIGDYYFGFLRSPAACDTKDSPRQIKAVDIQSKLYEALRTLEET